MPAVQVLRIVLIQNFRLDRDGQGWDVIRRREPGLAIYHRAGVRSPESSLPISRSPPLTAPMAGGA